MANFEWDSDKNDKNITKHNVSFEEAREVFADADSIEKFGYYKQEVRIMRIGKTTAKIILLVVYTIRDTIIRIISARQVSRDERNAYLEKKTQQSG